MATGTEGKQHMGNPHLRFDEKKVISAVAPRFGTIFHKPKVYIILSVTLIVSFVLTVAFVPSLRSKFITEQIRVGFRIPATFFKEPPCVQVFYKTTSEDAVNAEWRHFRVRTVTNSPSALTWFNLPLNANEFKIDLAFPKDLKVAKLPVDIMKSEGLTSLDFKVLPRRPNRAGSTFTASEFRYAKFCFPMKLSCMSWNVLYTLMSVLFIGSLLILLKGLIFKRSHVASLVKSLSLDKGDVLILFISSVLFLFFLWQNVSVNYGDEVSYLGNQSSSIFRLEPIRYRLLRTYGYCSIVTPLNAFVGAFVAKVVICIVQFLLFLLTCVWMRNVSLGYERLGRLHRWIPLFLVAANLYLIQSTSLCLTDIMAACLVAIGVSAIIYLPLTTLAIACVVGILTFAGMVRPSSLCFLLSVPAIYLVRFFCENDRFSVDKFLRPLPAAIVVFCIVIFPQLMINQNCDPARVRFPIVTDLAAKQKHWGKLYIKYETCVNKKLYRRSGVRYRMPDRLLKVPGGVRLGHVAAMLDQGEVDTYRRSFDSVRRKYASFLYYLYVWLAGLGVVSMLRHGRKLELAYLCLAVAPYIVLMSACAVEARFAYPCMLLAIPLAVHGMRFIYGVQGLLGRAFLLLSCGLWESAAFMFSYWLDTLRMV